MFIVVADVVSGQDPKMVEKEVDTVLQTFIQKGPNKKLLEVEKTKTLIYKDCEGAERTMKILIDALSARTGGGITYMKYLPHALFVVEAKHESIAVSEAKCLGIPTFGLVDTNTNPNYLDFPIPSNDDSIKSIKIILDYLSDSIFEVIGSKVTSDIPNQVSESPKVEDDTQSKSSKDDSNVTKK